MKIVKLIGGLGNQMFQYALYRSLKHKYPNEIVKVDTSLFETYRLHNGVELERIFPIKLDTASPQEIKKISTYWQNYFLQRLYRKLFRPQKSEIIQIGDSDFLPEVFQEEADLYYEGYWQNILYFSNIQKILLQEFRFSPLSDPKNQEIAKMLHQSDVSVCVHVRRGDYLQNAIYQGCCTEKYYGEAIKFFEEKFSAAHYYIFSDDTQWCSKFFSALFCDNRKFSIIDWNKGRESFIDMQLMTMAKGMILANSSFSWWAAQLNQREDKIVIAPKKWLSIAKENDRQLPEWILF